MPNTLTLTTPINVPNIRTVRVDRVREIDEAASVLRVRLSIEGLAGKVYLVPELTVANGQAMGVRATVSPVGFTDVVEVFTVSDASVATAFDTVLAAYKASGRTGVLTAMQGLGLLPAGGIA